MHSKRRSHSSNNDEGSSRRNQRQQAQRKQPQEQAAASKWGREHVTSSQLGQNLTQAETCKQCRKKAGTPNRSTRASKPAKHAKVSRLKVGARLQQTLRVLIICQIRARP